MSPTGPTCPRRSVQELAKHPRQPDGLILITMSRRGLLGFLCESEVVAPLVFLGAAVGVARYLA